MFYISRGHNFNLDAVITVGTYCECDRIYTMRCDPFSGNVALSLRPRGANSYLIRPGSERREILVREADNYEGPSHNSRTWHQGNFFRVDGEKLVVASRDFGAWTTVAGDLDIQRWHHMSLDSHGIVIDGTPTVTVYTFPTMKPFF